MWGWGEEVLNGAYRFTSEGGESIQPSGLSGLLHEMKQVEY